MSKSSSSARGPSCPAAGHRGRAGGKTGNPLRRALWLDALDRQLRPHLPASLAGHCRLANVKDEQLVFLVDSPVWHAKLRLAEQQLLVAARSVGLKVTRVTPKTTTTSLHSPMPKNPEQSKPVSAATHKGLREALASLQDIESKPRR